MCATGHDDDFFNQTPNGVIKEEDDSDGPDDGY